MRVRWLLLVAAGLGVGWVTQKPPVAEVPQSGLRNRRITRTVASRKCGGRSRAARFYFK
jgi:hypothetical protein